MGSIPIGSNMREKQKAERYKWDDFLQGYFKPKGKACKRYIHKIARRNKYLDINMKGIYNRIGVYHEWN